MSTLKMTSAMDIEMSVTVSNSPMQDYAHPDSYASPT